MTVAVVLFSVGILLSAFFSGSETGFYRMTRLRLVIDALAGDWVSRAMLWLANHPSLFVATTLVGNNLANYLASLAVVMGTHWLVPRGGSLSELLAPVVVAPVIFICGELLPKNIFYEAPNRLLRRCSPALVACTVLFAPITVLLWALSQLLRLFMNETPQELRLGLARRELGKLLREGHEIGILRPVQRNLAQAMLTLAAQPLETFATPARKVVRATTSMSKSDVLKLAQRHRRTLLPVEDVSAGRKLVGFVRAVDLCLSDAAALPEPLPLVTLRDRQTYLSALRKFSQVEDALGHVVDDQGKTVGFVTGRELRLAMFRTD